MLSEVLKRKNPQILSHAHRYLDLREQPRQQSSIKWASRIGCQLCLCRHQCGNRCHGFDCDETHFSRRIGIDHCDQSLYPVFPPDRSARDVLDWLRKDTCTAFGLTRSGMQFNAIVRTLTDQARFSALQRGVNTKEQQGSRNRKGLGLKWRVVRR